MEKGAVVDLPHLGAKSSSFVAYYITAVHAPTALPELRQASSLGNVTAGLGWDVAKGMGTDVDLVPRIASTMSW